MKKRDAIKYFGGVSKVAAALKIRSQSVSQWPSCVPPLRALQLEKITNGALSAEVNCNDNQPV